MLLIYYLIYSDMSYLLHTNLPTSSRQRASSWAFSLVNSSKGYCSLGNGAIGQSNDGISSLWIALECVVAKQPSREKPRTSYPYKLGTTSKLYLHIRLIFRHLYQWQKYVVLDFQRKEYASSNKNTFIERSKIFYIPKVLPWKLPIKDNILRSGQPGA